MKKKRKSNKAEVTIRLNSDVFYVTKKEVLPTLCEVLLFKDMVYMSDEAILENFKKIVDMVEEITTGLTIKIRSARKMVLYYTRERFQNYITNEILILDGLGTLSGFLKE